MRQQIVVSVLVIMSLIMFAGPSSAFDRNREGFTFGFGLGGSLTTYTVHDDYDNWESDRFNDLGIAHDLRFGGGVNEQFMVYFENRAAWFIMGDDDFDIEDGAVFSTSLIGGSYYFNPEKPSPYLLGSLGPSVFLTFEDASDIAFGFGMSFGVGFEFASEKTVTRSFELTLNFGHPKYDEVTFKGLSVMLVFFSTYY